MNHALQTIFVADTVFADGQIDRLFAPSSEISVWTITMPGSQRAPAPKTSSGPLVAPLFGGSDVATYVEKFAHAA